MPRLAAVAISLCLLLIATGSSVSAAEYDPTRPTSNKTSSGGGGGGGGGGGSDPNRKVALGVASIDPQPIAAFDAFSASIGGRKPAIWVSWVSWGATYRSFPTTLAEELRARNATLNVWWEPVTPGDYSDPTYARHINITRGDHDAYIRQFARDAKAFGGTVLLRFAQEMNNDYFPWSVNSFDNSPSTFIAAWRHVHAIFQAEGATNVRFVWSVAKKTCSGGCNPFAAVYPGDAYVDVMGFSAYNWGTYGNKTWNSMYDSYRGPVKSLREISSKPIMVAETGSNSEGGDKAEWIRQGYREVYERLPEISSIVYLDADLRSIGHPDWRIASPPAGLTAYAEIAALDQFSGRSPYKARADRKAHTEGTAKADRKRKAEATTEAGERQRREPRVRKGSAIDDEPAPESKAVGASNKVRKRKKDADDAPPATIDTFNR